MECLDWLAGSVWVNWFIKTNSHHQTLDQIVCFYDAPNLEVFGNSWIDWPKIKKTGLTKKEM